MPIYFTNGKVLETYDIIIDGSQYYYQTTKPSVSKGLWYYEAKHISGTSSSVIGFANSDGEEISISRNPSSETNNLSYYLISDDYNWPYNDTKIKYEEQYTLGLGLDINHRNFYVRFNDQDVRIYTFDKTVNINTKWNVMLRPKSQHFDFNHFQINFGYNDFEYDVPFGFTPWCKNLKLPSCFIQFRTHLVRIFSCVFLSLTK